MSNNTDKRLHAIISGRVQGVSFRFYGQQQALDLNLNGWIRNLPDGTVEVVAEGDENRLKQFHDWLHQGPPAARVRNVKADWSEASGEFDTFSITHAR